MADDSEQPKTSSWEDEFDDSAGTWERSAAAYREAPAKAEAERYAIYGSHACPWATRVKMAVHMLGLDDAIELIDADPVFGVIDEASGKTGWVFSDAFPDPLYGKSTLKQVYLLGNPAHDSKSTTPMLWDKHERRVLHNESREMIPILHDEFGEFARHPEVDLFRGELRERVFELYDEVYEPLLNGVYRAGFSSKQEVHDETVADMFACLDTLETRLANQRFALGQQFSFADLILFPTLWRFDFVYYIHFKCSLRRIQDYPALADYVRELWSWPIIRRCNDVELTRRHYYTSHYNINPSKLVAKVDLSWMEASHERGRLAQAEPYWFMSPGAEA